MIDHGVLLWLESVNVVVMFRPTVFQNTWVVKIPTGGAGWGLVLG